ncbi:MAG: flagellin [Balneolaceae bacterium]
MSNISQINTNLQALQGQSSLNKINSKLGDTQLQLSTGLRINRAEDDAAGFSIASKLTSRIQGLEQAVRNVGDAKSVLDIAETGLNSIMDILVDIKAKAVQGANDTLGATERGFIEDQIVALQGEINEIAGSTTFQGIQLLDDGAGDVTLTFQVGETSGDTLAVTLNQTNSTTLAMDAGITALDSTDATTFNALIDIIDTSIETLAGQFNQVGIDQTKLSIREENLDQAINSNSAARSRIQDADFAKVQSESIRLQILQQTATSALAQANTSPQSVLGFLG